MPASVSRSTAPSSRPLTSRPPTTSAVCSAQAEVRFTRHALLQMEARRIVPREVNEALDNPETSYDSRYRQDRRVVLGRTAGGRRLKIVITKDDPGMVITVADRDIEE